MQQLQQKTTFEIRDKPIGGSKKTIAIEPNDFLSFGGEANVYVHKPSNSVIKIFKDDNHFNRNGFKDKLEAMLTLQYDGITFPTHIVSHKGIDCGIVIPLVEGYTLLEYSEINAWQRFDFTLEDAKTIVSKMAEITKRANEAGFIMRDANPRNWLIEKTKSGFDIKIIDVDGWNFKHWVDDKILGSIIDSRKPSNTYDEYTDAYAWAVNAFMLLTGAHPYGGRAQGYGLRDLAGKRKDLLSVLNSTVTPPKNIRDFQTHIPDNLKFVFQEMLEKGEEFTANEILDIMHQGGSTLIDMSLFMMTSDNDSQPSQGGVSIKFDTLYSDASDPAIWITEQGFAFLKSGKVYDIKENRLFHTPKGFKGQILRDDENSLRILVGKTKANQYTIDFYDKTTLYSGITTNNPYFNPPLEVDKLYITGSSIYALRNGGMDYVDYIVGPNKVTLMPRSVGEYNPNTIKFFHDCATVPYGEKNHVLVFSKENHFPEELQFPELDNKEILDLNATTNFVFAHTFDKVTGIKEDHIFHRTSTSRLIKSFSHNTKDVSDAISHIIQYQGKVAWINRQDNVCVFNTESGNTTKIPQKITSISKMVHLNNYVVILKNGEILKISTQR